MMTTKAITALRKDIEIKSAKGFRTYGFLFDLSNGRKIDVYDGNCIDWKEDYLTIARREPGMAVTTYICYKDIVDITYNQGR